ncbi:MAG: hypothetical protein Q8904_02380 [Bacteroidota bacterium]|nr:hypothetical protein [Bacteroidota bacterium]
MQDNTNNKKPDAFSEIFRQKLENHEIPVTANSWDEIDVRLKFKRKRITPFWFWLSGGAAVAALALLFILRPLNETKDIIGKSTSANSRSVHAPKGSIANYRHSISPKLLKKSSVQIGLIANNQPSKATQSTKAPVKKAKIRTQASDPVQSTRRTDYPPARADITDSVGINKNVAENDKKKENDIARNTSVGKDSVSKKGRNIPSSLVEEPFNRPIAKTKNKNNWLLAAAVGSNGRGPADNNNYELATGSQNTIGKSASYASVVKPTGFTDISYNPPISLGLIIRKNLSNGLGLESGLVYTYLLTTFGSNVKPLNDAQLHLHYIGVPLNLVVQLWNSSKWEIYLSGGGMVEKGLKSVYIQNQYGGSQTITTKTITDIDGIQWSINGTVGTTYKIQHNLGIFFEPKVSYYFDDDQPISARTKYPAVIGLSAGVRFQFE